MAASTAKVAHMIRVTHRDEVEAPMTDWLREAYDFCGTRRAARGAATASPVKKTKAARPAKKKRAAAVDTRARASRARDRGSR
jgi:hypothetical protein